VTKQFIDNLKGTKDKLQEIRDIARSLKTALYDQEWELVGNLIGKEWEIRRTLADGVSTGRIESIMEAAKEAGAWSSKICGAGGGGCMITMADPEHRGVVETAIQSTGGTLIPMKFDLQGVSAEVTSQ
jgi:D-glycero-alpha-D-manno-heptose-7-phosphate kinase